MHEQDPTFPPFRLDLANERLWRGAEPLALRPKQFLLLRYLAEHPGRLITQKELLQAVWKHGYVSDGLLRGYIRKLRSVLGDDAKNPRYIETAAGRGYRFIAPLTSSPAVPRFIESSVAHKLQPPLRFVGRHEELAQLHGALERALSGERQVVFVTGEPGMGKTALIEAFLARVPPDLPVACGQCAEQLGPGEAYRPVLESLGQLCRREGRAVELLGRYAPTWLMQLPWLLSEAERTRLKRELLGATRERMLREGAEFLQAWCQETPLILVVEDLHWSDAATVEWLSLLVRQRRPARLLLLASYRPVDLILHAHPLKVAKEELHGLYAELSLELLSVADVAAYLARRLPGQALPEGLAQALYRRTEGQPLFIVSVVEEGLAQGWLLRGSQALEKRVPEGLRQLIEQRLDRLAPPERRVLEVGSVQGAMFNPGLVAAVLQEDLLKVEDCCAQLAHEGRFLQIAGEGQVPERRAAGRYAFCHALYQEALYGRIPLARRARLHRQMGQWMEAILGQRRTTLAAELALHFEAGREYAVAIRYLQLAAENAARRYANREAIAYLARAVEFVERLPEAERTSLCAAVLEQRGMVRRSMDDMAGALEDFEAMVCLSRQEGAMDKEVKALLCAATVLTWVDRKRCLAAADRAVELSCHLQDELLRVHARAYGASRSLEFRGWRDEYAQTCAEAVKAAREAGDRPLLSLYLPLYAYYQCHQSDYRAACRTAEEGLQVALEVGDAYHYMSCQVFQALALLHSGRWGAMRGVLRDACQMAEKNGHRLATICFQLQTAWLHKEAFDFDRARALCEQVLKQMQQIGHHQTWPLFIGIILAGFAHLGLKQYEQAFNYFNEIPHRLEREGLLMDWILHLPFHHGLSQYWLAQSEYERARCEAQRLCALAAQSGERTYLALGYKCLAECALAEADTGRAEAELSQALALLEGGEIPLAAWRVYALAGELHARVGRTQEAQGFWEKAAFVIHALADSLGEDHAEARTLRASFLNAPPVRRILDQQ